MTGLCVILFNILRNCLLFPKVVALLCVPTRSVLGSSLSTSSPTLTFFSFLIIAMIVKWLWL